MYGRAGYNVAKQTWNKDALNVNLSGKHFVVTGANAGIGRNVCQVLAEKNATVQ